MEETIVISYLRGYRQYELSYHLGNVLATVSDKKFGIDSNDDEEIDYFEPEIITASDYYPFGMLMPGRGGSLINGQWQESGPAILTNFSVDDRTGNQPSEYVALESIEFLDGFESGLNDEFVAYITTSGIGGSYEGEDGLYRYGFNGKENDNETGTQDYGFRIYNPGLGRFLSVDPLTASYPWYSPYQYAGNKPVRFIDRDGLEEAENRYFWSSFFSFFFPPKNPKTPLGVMSNHGWRSVHNYSNTRAGKFTNGFINTGVGLVGTIASVSYITGTSGTGAALGGVVALQLSLGEMAIGISQMAEVLSSNSPSNDFLHNSTTVPGLISYGMGSRFAPFIDATAALGPSFVTGEGIGLKKVFESFTQDPTFLKTLESFDQLKDLKDFTVESIELFNTFNSNKTELKGQWLKYSISYKVQKGDNLKTIAKRLNISVESLIKQNNIIDPDKINEGQTLKYNNVLEFKKQKNE